MVIKTKKIYTKKSVRTKLHVKELRKNLEGEGGRGGWVGLGWSPSSGSHVLLLQGRLSAGTVHGGENEPHSQSCPSCSLWKLQCGSLIKINLDKYGVRGGP